MATKTWRQRSAEVIDQTLAGLPKDATLEQKKSALKAAYPFGIRKYHPYKIWCDEVKNTIGDKPRKRHEADETTLFDEE